jgi:hypothetical protein
MDGYGNSIFKDNSNPFYVKSKLSKPSMVP